MVEGGSGEVRKVRLCGREFQCVPSACIPNKTLEFNLLILYSFGQQNLLTV